MSDSLIYGIFLSKAFPIFSFYILCNVPLKNNISHCVIFQINEQGFSGLLSEFCKSALRALWLYLPRDVLLCSSNPFYLLKNMESNDHDHGRLRTVRNQRTAGRVIMSQRKTKLMWPEVIVRPNCGLSGTYVVSGRVKKYFRILDMEVIMLLMVWNAKVSIAPISFLIQEIPCNTKLGNS